MWPLTDEKRLDQPDVLASPDQFYYIFRNLRITGYRKL